MASTSLSGERAALLIQHFGDRVLLVFGWFYFNIEYKRDPDRLSKSQLSIRATYVLPTMENACLITTLMVMRDIDDFFTPREPCLKKKRPVREDDLKASDLGIETNLSFLTDSERKTINKHLVHSTHSAAYENLDVNWDIGELATKCISQSIHFLTLVKSSLPPAKYQETVAAAHFYREGVKAACGYVKKRLSKTNPD